VRKPQVEEMDEQDLHSSMYIATTRFHKLHHLSPNDTTEVGAVLLASPVLENTLSLVSVSDLFRETGGGFLAVPPAVKFAGAMPPLVGEVRGGSSAKGEIEFDAVPPVRGGLLKGRGGKMEELFDGCSGIVAVPPCASRRRYSTHKLEKLCSRP